MADPKEELREESTRVGVEAPEVLGQKLGPFATGEGDLGEEEIALEVDEEDTDQVGEKEVRKESSTSSDDKALENLIARMKEKRRDEAKTTSRRVKAIAKKVVLPLESVTLEGRTPNTRGKSKTSLEKTFDESKKKKKSSHKFRLVDKSDVEEVDLVSEVEYKKKKKKKNRRRKSLFRKKERKRLNLLHPLQGEVFQKKKI
uniref:NF-kappa-B-activating protein-like n=1 Tax=Nicotiana tabacum TaxID=4097 RepID=A0A1S3XCP8_TOBAC|nr:PREDICTED: NF-kappa-B-activating protein-like [Nicotiana tabacum]